MEWSLITNWLFDFFAAIGSFVGFLFEPIKFSDVIVHITTLFGNIFNTDSELSTMIQVLQLFFEENGMGRWFASIEFTPIALLSVTGLIVALVMAVIKGLSVFA